MIPSCCGVMDSITIKASSTRRSSATTVKPSTFRVGKGQRHSALLIRDASQGNRQLTRHQRVRSRALEPEPPSSTFEETEARPSSGPRSPLVVLASTEPQPYVSSSFFVGRSAYEQGTKICRRADATSHKALYPFPKVRRRIPGTQTNGHAPSHSREG